MNKRQERFENILKQSFIESVDTPDSTRSNKRLELIHGFFAKEIEKEIIKLEEEGFIEERSLNVISKGLGSGGEFTFKGPLFNKDTDISIINKKGEIIMAFLVKFVFSNYSQNQNNYFEQMVGESLNLSLGKVNSFNIFVIRDNTPYFTKKKESISRVEKINHKIKKHNNFTNGDIHLTDGLFYCTVDFNDKIVNERFSKKETLIWNEYKEELLSSLKVKEINYPLKRDCDNKKMLNLNELFQNVYDKLKEQK